MRTGISALVLLLGGCSYFDVAMVADLGVQPRLIKEPRIITRSEYLRPRAQPCACPRDRNNLGQYCGRDSVYSRTGGHSFSCVGRI